MNKGFTQEAVEAVGEKWPEIKEYNDSLHRLERKKLSLITPEDKDLGWAKVAWKIRVFQQAVLYRIVMLSNGCAEMWNMRNVLASALCARAIMESTAFLWDFEKQLQEFCEQGNFKAIDELCTNRTFSTRLKDWFSQTDCNTQSVNILTLLDKFDKYCEGARKHYDSLSELCHPNSLGHYMAFAKLDRTEGVVKFSDSTKFDNAMFHHVVGGFMMILFVEKTYDAIDNLLPRIIELSKAAQDTQDKQ